ncbi:MAG: hypothetical protein WA816_12850 [Bacteroidales bacterium]
MNRRILYAVAFILMIPFSFTSAQNKKSEQKIKILVNDGSGSKVLVDTAFSDSKGPDSLILKDGTVVYLKHPDNAVGYRNHKGEEHFYVTYSSDGKEHGREYKEVTVITSDSAAGDGNVRHYSNSSSSSNSNSNSDNHHKKYRIVTRNSQDSGDVFVNKSDNDSTMNRTKYVIAKDGMVVTVEGNDEARAKELVKDIENKLGVNNPEEKKNK